MVDMLGVSFDKKHSYRTWRMLLKSDPVISPPKVKKKLVEVPGTNKVIDLTESLTGGEVKYHMRSLRCVFYVIGGRQKWPAVYSAVLNEIHGRRCRSRWTTTPTITIQAALRGTNTKAAKPTPPLLLRQKLSRTNGRGMVMGGGCNVHNPRRWEAAV